VFERKGVVVELEVYNSPDYVDPRLLAPPPRKAALSRKGARTSIIRAILQLLLPVWVIVSMIFAIRSDIGTREVMKSQTVVSATVTDTEADKHSCSMNYKYYYNGVKHEGSDSISYDSYNVLKAGDKIKVYIVPEHPEISSYGHPTMLDLLFQDLQSLWLTILVGFFILVGSNVYGNQLKDELTYARRGLVTYATVTSQVKSDRKIRVHVNYTVDPKTDYTAAIDFETELDYPAGTVVSVIYLPASPESPMLVSQLKDIVLY
jgi:hypothetical protein